MKKDDSIKDASPHINVTPLIDVLLVLLIIFMIISPLAPSRFAASVPSEPRPDDNMIKTNILALVVTIEKDLSIKLNQQDKMGSVNDTGALAAALAETFAERRKNGVLRENAIGQNNLSGDAAIEKTVFIKAPRGVAYGDVVKVVDAVKGAGAEPIGLQIDDLE